jgi:hypothetical protein
MAAIRQHIPALEDDRYMARDINIMTQLIRDGLLIESAGIDHFFDATSSPKK